MRGRKACIRAKKEERRGEKERERDGGGVRRGEGGRGADRQTDRQKDTNSSCKTVNVLYSRIAALGLFLDLTQRQSLVFH